MSDNFYAPPGANLKPAAGLRPVTVFTKLCIAICWISSLVISLLCAFGIYLAYRRGVPPATTRPTLLIMLGLFILTTGVFFKNRIAAGLLVIFVGFSDISIRVYFAADNQPIKPYLDVFLLICAMGLYGTLAYHWQIKKAKKAP